MMETKYIVKAYTPRTKAPWKEDEVLIDLVELTDMDAMVKVASRKGVEGVALKTAKPLKAYFVELETFADFMFWKYVLNDGE